MDIAVQRRDPADIRRGRSRQGAQAGRRARRRLSDDAGVSRRAVRQPVQPLRPAVARVPPGRGRRAQRRRTRIGQFYVRNNDGAMVPLVHAREHAADDRDRSTRTGSTSIAPCRSPARRRPATARARRWTRSRKSRAQTLPSEIGYDWADLSYQEQRASGSAAPMFALSLARRLSGARGALRELVAAVLGAAVGAGRDGRRVRRSGDAPFRPERLRADRPGDARRASRQRTRSSSSSSRRRGCEHGLPLAEAALEGARVRLRPIVMTSFAFIFGCVPLVIAAGAGATSRQILGTAVVAGMLLATVVAVHLHSDAVRHRRAAVRAGPARSGAAGPSHGGASVKVARVRGSCSPRCIAAVAGCAPPKTRAARSRPRAAAARRFQQRRRDRPVTGESGLVRRVPGCRAAGARRRGARAATPTSDSPPRACSRRARRRASRAPISCPTLSAPRRRPAASARRSWAQRRRARRARSRAELRASWELDFWGRLRNSTAAARADVLAAEWARRAVVTDLISDVASSTSSCARSTSQLDIAQRTLASRQASLRAGARARAGRRDVAARRPAGRAARLRRDRHDHRELAAPARAGGTCAGDPARSAVDQRDAGLALGRPAARCPTCRPVCRPICCSTGPTCSAPSSSLDAASARRRIRARGVLSAHHADGRGRHRQHGADVARQRRRRALVARGITRCPAARRSRPAGNRRFELAAGAARRGDD